MKRRLSFWKIVTIGAALVAVGAVGTCLMGPPGKSEGDEDLVRGLGFLLVIGLAVAVAIAAALISHAVDDP